MKDSHKKLVPHASFDSAYWTQAAEYYRDKHAVTEIQRKISERDFQREHGGGGTFMHTAKAEELLQQLRATETDENLCLKQATELKGKPGQKTPSYARRAFIRLFTTSKLGLGNMSTGAGRRESSKQSNFRQDLIKAYDSRHPNPRNPDSLWCPVLKHWVDDDATTAAHIFAYMHTQETMDTIFGPMKPPELFSPRNGLILSSRFEKWFDKGFFVIVPKLPDDPSEAQKSLWRNSEPKEYMVRILDLTHPEVDRPVTAAYPTTWGNLDRSPLVFRNDFRPRARYLYFHYCLQVLRRAWSAKPQAQHEIMKKDHGKSFWGTPGRYLPYNMLASFVEELGHKYEHLLEGAADDSPAAEEDREILLATATNQIEASARQDDDEDDDEDAGEEEDEEEDDEDDKA